MNWNRTQKQSNWFYPTIILIEMQKAQNIDQQIHRIVYAVWNFNVNSFLFIKPNCKSQVQFASFALLIKMSGFFSNVWWKSMLIILTDLKTKKDTRIEANNSFDMIVQMY